MARGPDTKPRRARTLPPTAPLAQQAGGHAGVHVTEDESLLLKPALPREVAFYQFVRDIDDSNDDDPSSASASTGLHALRDWIPQFLGLLNLEGKLADDDSETATPGGGGTVPAEVVAANFQANAAGTAPIAIVPASAETSGISDLPPQTLVLQNLLYGYSKPCVLDVKLGTVLYDDDASEEKKARMIKKAAESTTLETGVRLTGFQVYSNHSPDPTVYGREYGYNLTPDQLPDGIRSFFPCSDVDRSRSSSPHQDNTAGLPADTLMTLLTFLHDSLINIRGVLAGAHLRIVGGSVLIIYEGDWDRATAASGRGGGPSILEADVIDEDDEEDEIAVEVDEHGQIIVESLFDGPGPSRTSASSSSSCADDDDPRSRLYTVSLIDFAHTRIVPGEGPDQGVLKGMDTLIRLVDQRRQEVATKL